MKILICLYIINIIILISILAKGHNKLGKIKGIQDKGNLQNTDKLCGHEVKSLVDAYALQIRLLKTVIAAECIYLIGMILLYIGRIQWNNIIEYIGIYLLIVKWIYYLAINIFSIYEISEIKHLSPEDGIYVYAIEGKDIYLGISRFGMINMVISLLNIFAVCSLKYSIITILISGIIGLLGLGDVLNNSNYNGEKSCKNRMKMMIEILHRLIRYFINKEFRVMSNKILKGNLKNICIAIRHEKIFTVF